jgi:hypothetical protein
MKKSKKILLVLAPFAGVLTALSFGEKYGWEPKYLLIGAAMGLLSGVILAFIGPRMNAWLLRLRGRNSS